ncbi:MAG: hypothetical protein FJ087_11425 [Deltaproteobacteria bacterium]|nr:hypothetical protein [Deltaproteobacteria bacterium]
MARTPKRPRTPEEQAAADKARSRSELLWWVKAFAILWAIGFPVCYWVLDLGLWPSILAAPVSLPIIAITLMYLNRKPRKL